jgi:TetR/AcrR family transcriptional regulator
MSRALPDDLAERLRALAEEFAAQGTELRIAEVADSTAIPRTTLYYYFADRQELLGWFLMELLDQRRDAMSQAFNGPGSPADRLAAGLECQLWFIAEHPAAYRALMSNLAGAGDLDKLADHAQRVFHRPARQLIEQARSIGWFSNVTDSEATVTALFGAVTMTGLHYVVVDGRLDVAHVGTAIIGHLMGGLGAPPTAGDTETLNPAGDDREHPGIDS